MAEDRSIIDDGWQDLKDNPAFLTAMLKILAGMEQSMLDLDKVRVVKFPEIL